MSASMVPITASPASAAKRTPILSGDKKFDYIESLANGESGDTNKDLIRGESIFDRSRDLNSGPVTRRSVLTVKDTNATATHRKTRKVATPKPEKSRLKRVARIIAKQLCALLILVGLIQLTRKMILMASSPSSSPVMAFPGLESRIAEVNGQLVTKKTMQVQVDLLDKKIKRESRSLKKEIETESSTIHSELKKIESRTGSLESSFDEVKAKPLVSRDELDRIYEEFKKGKVDDSDSSIDEMRAYARENIEKEIEKHAADGLGLVDYALAGGGFVMHHSDPYLKGRNWFATSSRCAHANAVKMLSPSFGEPGQCFSLKGSDGYVQIRLRAPIVPEAFTLEHVAKSVAYDRSSAPKDCIVSGWLQGKGLESLVETETMRVLAEFSYDLERSSAQTFKVLGSSGSGVVDTVRLEFTSNHGSNSHTCIYRFRVHGRVPEPVSVV